MLRNYLAAALRNLARNRMYAAINIAGLAVGFAAAILAMLYVRDELSFDRWIPGYERIYRVSPDISPPDRAKLLFDPVPEQTAAWLETDFPEVEAATRLSHPAQLGLRRLPVEGTETLYWADPDFLDVVPLPVIAGDPHQALQAPDGLVMTRRLARKYFGNVNPIGQRIDLLGGPVPQPMRVLAVLEDLPSNSHFNIELLGSSRAPFSTLAMLDANPQPATDFMVRAHTYFRLAKGTSIDRLRAQMPAFLKRHKAGNGAVDEGLVSFVIRSIAEIHFSPGEQFMLKPRGSRAAMYGILAIGLLIVAIAVINFVNLTTARTARRSMEVGVRKAAGASRGTLFAQFIGESLIYCVLGALVAVALAELALPFLNAFLDRGIRFDYWRDPQLTGGILLLVALAAVCGGAYPALVLAAFQPARVLKEARVQRSESGRARALLVAAQFCILIVLIICAGVVYRQTYYSMNAALRLDKDQVLLVRSACNDSFKDKVAALPGVRSAACSSQDALNMDVWWSAILREGRTAVQVRRASVDFDFFQTYGIQPVAGRTFSRDYGADRLPDDLKAPVTVNLVINEAAARRLGFADPRQAVGQAVRITNVRAEVGPAQVIGVVPDFQFSASHLAVDPFAYYIDLVAGRPFMLLNVKLAGDRVPETVQQVDAAWKTSGASTPINRRFVDDYVQELYRTEQRQSGLLGALSVIAVVIACLGLFGLTAFATERRTKEIGIRKALGADAGNIVRLLVWQFTKPVLWANLVAWPLAAWLMTRWLASFAYHIGLSPLFFAAATTIAIVIALVTVASHCILIARAKPVSALRYE